MKNCKMKACVLIYSCNKKEYIFETCTEKEGIFVECTYTIERSITSTLGLQLYANNILDPN